MSMEHLDVFFLICWYFSFILRMHARAPCTCACHRNPCCGSVLNAKVRTRYHAGQGGCTTRTHTISSLTICKKTRETMVRTRKKNSVHVGWNRQTYALGCVDVTRCEPGDVHARGHTYILMRYEQYSMQCLGHGRLHELLCRFKPPHVHADGANHGSFAFECVDVTRFEECMHTAPLHAQLCCRHASTDRLWSVLHRTCETCMFRRF
jgi:hypothetical protein